MQITPHRGSAAPKGKEMEEFVPKHYFSIFQGLECSNKRKPQE